MVAARPNTNPRGASLKGGQGVRGATVFPEAAAS